MEKFSLTAIAREQLEQAKTATSGRSASTIFGGHEHALRQTVVALVEGSSLDEHESPGEATVHVLTGRVRLTAGNDAWTGRTGDLLVVPAARHALDALEDSTILLTVAKSPRERTAHRGRGGGEVGRDQPSSARVPSLVDARVVRSRQARLS
jgi:quercetin dioxygenase-like cupin family protein